MNHASIRKSEFQPEFESKNDHKIQDHCHCHYIRKYRGASHSICNLRYRTPKETTAVFHNTSSYDYHLIIKELAKELEGQF